MMTHPHCSVAAKRLSALRAAILATPTSAAHWQKDAILYELDMIGHKLAEISLDHHALESR